VAVTLQNGGEGPIAAEIGYALDKRMTNMIAKISAALIKKAKMSEGRRRAACVRSESNVPRRIGGSQCGAKIQGSSANYFWRNSREHRQIYD
jgi:hypothetical protein